MAHPGRRIAHSQHLRGLVVGELLEVAKQDDLAVIRLELVDRRLETPLQLLAEGLGRRREGGIPELSGQVERRSVGECTRTGAELQGTFAVEAPLGGLPMPPVGVDHVVAQICRSQRWNGRTGLRR